MHTLIIVLTALTVALILWQILGTKGTTWHAIRGMSTGIASATLVILVVILTLRQGAMWTFPLVLHLAVGTLYFISLFRTVTLGIQNRLSKLDLSFVFQEDLRAHRWWARATVVLLVFTLISAFAASNYPRALQKTSPAVAAVK